MCKLICCAVLHVSPGSVTRMCYACAFRNVDILSCDALPFSYARENSTVILQEMSLVDNTVTRGSAISVISSHLETYKVRPEAAIWSKPVVNRTPPSVLSLQVFSFPASAEVGFPPTASKGRYVQRGKHRITWARV